MKIPERKNKSSLHEVLFRTLNCSLGYFIFGYSLGIFTSSQPCISSLLHWGSDENIYIAVMSSLISLGAVLGCVTNFYLSKFYGKRKVLILADILVIITSGIVFFPNTFTFGISRFLTGIAAGCYSMTCPQYINEFTPAEVRGKMGNLNQLFCVLGLIISFTVCLLLPIGKCEENIEFYVLSMFAAPLFPSLLQLIILSKVYTTESPQWLLKPHNSIQSSTGSLLSRLNASENLKNPKETLKSNMKGFKSRAFRLGLALHLFQQLSGVNAVLFYSTTIFENLGGGVFISRLLTIFACFCRILANFILFPIIDKSGRKKVTVIGLVGMGITFILIALLMQADVPLLQMALINLFFVLFTVSIGPICWIYSSEVLRDKLMAFCTGVNWSCSFVVVLLFPFIVDAIGLNFTFIMFGAINVIAAAYFAKDMVETKGMSKEEIKMYFIDIDGNAK